ncbi:unnamed protein product [Arctia plantaginis]|uniref:PiggyBac transposable element-derived protein 4 C-terminal zinc-ribbon domain-containing protein n=1 Tax=Arctia plantaginis TaxID=874455 RepID=A0A8S0Z3K7_ARCPL|nr:unnamed protein product [Arctia plantaginis]
MAEIGWGSCSSTENLATPLSPSSDSRHRRTKHFKRQSRVPEDSREVRKQTSDPLPPTPVVPKTTPTLQKYESYPQFAPSKGLLTRKPRIEQEVGSLLIRPVSATERQSSSTTTTTSTTASFESSTTSESSQTPRASHTPAVRSGPPLSCNFCWNTVDECGRILRRKTQYHCPECRTNLCIVPCFHEYHEGPETDTNTNAR